MLAISTNDAELVHQMTVKSYELVLRMKSMQTQMQNLRSLFGTAVFMIAKHHHDKLTYLQKDHLIVQHNLLTCLQLIKLELYDNIPMNNPLSQQKLYTSVISLEKRLAELTSILFTKTKTTLLL